MTEQANTPEPAFRNRRVVLGATCYADADAALSFAVALARQVKAELHGILVRDKAILSAADRPRALAVSYSGHGTSSITAEAMQRAFVADAKRFETKLAATARASSLSAVFSATEGGLPDALHQTVLAGDLAILGFRRATRDSGSLVVLLDEGGEIPAFAAELASTLGKRLTLLRHMPGRAARHADLVYGAGPETLIADNAKAMLRHLGRSSPAAIIMASHRAVVPTVFDVINAARCPVIFDMPVDGDPQE